MCLKSIHVGANTVLNVVVLIHLEQYNFGDGSHVDFTQKKNIIVILLDLEGIINTCAGDLAECAPIRP